MKRGKRRYTLRARGEQMEETRRRIVDATVALHEEVGPRHTTISAIAERAGVERLTVYRHFPDEAAVFAACSHRFSELNPPPDPAAWAGQMDARAQTAEALQALYGYFARTHRMLDRIYRDVSEYPSLREIMDGFDGYLRGLADDLARNWNPGQRRTKIRNTLRHAVRFSTWSALEQEPIANAAKVELVLGWLDGLAT